MLEAVLDTNVLVAALRSQRGAAFLLLEGLQKGLWRSVISVSLALEYEAVLKRPAFSGWIRPSEIDPFLVTLFDTALCVDQSLRLRPLSADPNDEHVIELALKTKRPIITFNRRDFVVVTTMGLEIFTPAEWLVKLIER